MHVPYIRNFDDLIISVILYIKKANNALKIVSLKLFELLTIDYWQII